MFYLAYNYFKRVVLNAILSFSSHNDLSLCSHTLRVCPTLTNLYCIINISPLFHSAVYYCRCSNGSASSEHVTAYGIYLTAYTVPIEVLSWACVSYIQLCYLTFIISEYLASHLESLLVSDQFIILLFDKNQVMHQLFCSILLKYFFVSVFFSLQVMYVIGNLGHIWHNQNCSSSLKTKQKWSARDDVKFTSALSDLLVMTLIGGLCLS